MPMPSRLGKFGLAKLLAGDPKPKLKRGFGVVPAMAFPSVFCLTTPFFGVSRATGDPKVAGVG